MSITVSAYPTADTVPQTLTAELTVVIDTLRMTSVAATALANGCPRLLAVESIEEARSLAPQFNALLCGERVGLRIDGFDMGNSPLEYTAEHIAGRSIIITTTNGTRAIAKAKSSPNVWLASLLNAQAVAEHILSSPPRSLAIICAGTVGLFSMEDALTAGSIIHQLGQTAVCDDFARTCLILYESLRHNVKDALRIADHPQRLINLGFERDFDFCVQENVIKTIPALGGDGWFTAL